MNGRPLTFTKTEIIIYIENADRKYRKDVPRLKFLEQLERDEIEEMSLIEIAYEILNEKKQPLPFKELLNEVAAILNLSEQEVDKIMAQFYTDLNIDGKFMNVGGNTWAIKSWYPVDKIEDDIVPTVRTKKKKVKLDDIDADDYEVLDDEDYEDLDDLDEFEDDLDEDELLDDEDLLDDTEDDFVDELDEDGDELLLDDDLVDEDLLLDDEEE